MMRRSIYEKIYDSRYGSVSVCHDAGRLRQRQMCSRRVLCRKALQLRQKQQQKPKVKPKVYPDEAYLDGINLGDFVELGDYKGVDVTVTKAEVTDEMVDQYIQSVLDSNKNKEEVDRAVKDGDVVDIKYVGKRTV